jgi:hypothetical protein
MLYVRFPLSLRNVEDLLHERGIDVSHETVRFWWNRFGPMSELPHRHQPPSSSNKVFRRTVLRRLSSPLKAIERPPPHALGFGISYASRDASPLRRRLCFVRCRNDLSQKPSFLLK